MTLDEKASLTAGIDLWHTAAIPRLGIPSVKFTDGPNGARGGTVGFLSVTPSLCIPSGTALAATWDPALVAEASAAVARQARDKGARVLLAPTVNLHRHPLWGRNFEAFSEDPLLTAKLAVAYIRGVQDQGVIATVKHLIGNETEFERYTSSSVIDERTLRELYLLPFEHAVKVAGVLAVMTSYNRVNGAHVPDTSRFLTEILRQEWGFDGFVMTDWYGLSNTVEAAGAGLDLEMPGPARSFGATLGEAVRGGQVEEAVLDAKVERMLTVFDGVGALDDPELEQESPVDRPEDREIARRAASEAAVLLANRGVLPLRAGALRKIAVVGPNADQPAIMGGGSARVTPHYLLSPLQALRLRLGDGVEIVHEEGADDAGIERAANLARDADAVVVIVGTDQTVESEGYDRATINLPGKQDELVRGIVRVTPDAVVVVNSGSPVAMPWAAEAGALLQIEHSPAFGNFPGESSEIRYAEGLLIGYRWYEARRLPVRFPFGHGLSYTTFGIGPPRLSSTHLAAGGRLQVDVVVTNTGTRRGSEVVQLYVGPPDGGSAAPDRRLRPVKELKAFAKVRLDPGESTTVRLGLGERSFAYYDVADEAWQEMVHRRANPPAHVHDGPLHHRQAGWYVDSGTYQLHIGRSSADIAHVLDVEVDGGSEPLATSVSLD
jgi:beta-glucosidase